VTLSAVASCTKSLVGRDCCRLHKLENSSYQNIHPPGRSIIAEAAEFELREATTEAENVTFGYGRVCPWAGAGAEGHGAAGAKSDG
jgi:hypothetical protein